MPRYVAVKGSERTPLPGSRVIGRVNPGTMIDVSIKIRRKKKLPDLKTRPAVIMTRRVLATGYGASARDIAKVVKVFGSFSLKKLTADAATRTVELRGTAANLEDAFHTRLFNYEHKDGSYRGRVGALHVPPAVKNIVEAVFGLDNRRVARRRRQATRAVGRLSKKSVLDAWYSPSQLAKHYNFPDGNGSTQTLGLLEFGGGYFPSDLKKFCKLVGVAAPKIMPISVDGTSTSKRDGDEAEVMLDVEVMAGICPRATIVIYFAEWTERGWISALDAMLQDEKNDPSVVSISWGNAENTEIWTNQAIAQINEALKQAAYLGVTVCVAAGDDGSSDAVRDGLAHVDFPSSSPYALSIGGTTIPAKNKAEPDIVWKEGNGLRAHGGGSTGGGVSAVFPRPNWQRVINIKSVNPGAIVGRCVPDVAANADWTKSPYLLVVDGKPQPNGGTSAASPLWAALIARINAKRPLGKRIGYFTPVLYQRRTGRSRKSTGAVGCIDVQSGNNATDHVGGYVAVRGYDAASGWGTPDGKKLLAVLCG
jgi:kumamolisin